MTQLRVHCGHRPASIFGRLRALWRRVRTVAATKKFLLLIDGDVAVRVTPTDLAACEKLLRESWDAEYEVHDRV